MNNTIIQTDIKKALISNPHIARIIGDTMPVERFAESAYQLFQNPAISTCTQESVLGCILKAAVFGFRLSPELGQCWAVPRNIKTKGPDGKETWAKVATFQIGYKGWMELALRSGEVESFDAAVVREGDVFEYEKGSTPFLKYRAGQGKGRITHAWASATMRSGRVVFHVVDADEIERHRRMSDNQKDAQTPTGIWAAHFDAMAKRIPMRYLCALQLPKSELMRQAVEADGGVTEIVGGEVRETAPALVAETAQPMTSLHDDYIDEVRACRSKDALKNLYNQRKADMPSELIPLYYQLITEHAKNLQQ